MAPIAIPFLFIVWVCGGFRKCIAVSVRGDLSVPLDEFIAKLKEEKIKYVCMDKTVDITYLICNAPERFPSLGHELKSNRHTKDTKVVTEEEFWNEINSLKT